MDLEALMSTLGRRDYRGIADQRVVDTRIGDKVGLELVQVDVEGTVEPKRRGDGADDLGDQAVQVLVVRSLDTQVASADVVDGLVVDQEGTIRVLNGAVRGEDGIVGLDDSSRDTRSGVDGKLELALFAILGGETLKEEGTKARASTATKGVEDQEALQRVAIVGHASDAVDDALDHLLADGVVTTGVVVGSIFLATNQELGVEEGSVVAGTDLVDGRRVQVDEEGPGHVLAIARLGEKSLV